MLAPDPETPEMLAPDPETPEMLAPDLQSIDPGSKFTGYPLSWRAQVWFPTSQVFRARPPLQTSHPGTGPTWNFFLARPPLQTFLRPRPHFQVPSLLRSLCARAGSAPSHRLPKFSELVPHFKLPTSGTAPTWNFFFARPPLPTFTPGTAPTWNFFFARPPLPTFTPGTGPTWNFFFARPPLLTFLPAVAPLPTLGARAPHLRRLRIPAVDDRKKPRKEILSSSLTFFLRTAVA